MLDWGRWETLFSRVWEQLSDDAFLTRWRKHDAVCKRVFELLGAAVSSPGRRMPMELLRLDAPPPTIANDWWNALHWGEGSWGSHTRSSFVEARHIYMEALTHGIPHAITRTIQWWDTISSMSEPTTLPATIPKTLFRMCVALESFETYREHAKHLLQQEAVAYPDRAKDVAAMLYEIDQLNADPFRKTLLSLGIESPSIELPEAAMFASLPNPDPPPSPEPSPATVVESIDDRIAREIPF